MAFQVRRISSSFWVLESSRLRSGKKGKRSTLSHGWRFVSLTATHRLNALYAANTFAQLVSKRLLSAALIAHCYAAAMGATYMGLGGCGGGG